jgi:methylmalonyl-CoA/ethylmalonyl-CoA epimerase
MLCILLSTYLATNESPRNPTAQSLYPISGENDALTNELPLDHVAIAVPSIEEAIPLYQRLLGATASAVEHLPAQSVRVSFIGALELIEPTSPETPVGRFLEKKGPSLHHVAFRTRDLTAELEALRRAGYRLLDEVPRPGARGHKVAFLHPSGTGGVLVELVEHG